MKTLCMYGIYNQDPVYTETIKGETGLKQGVYGYMHHRHQYTFKYLPQKTV